MMHLDNLIAEGFLENEKKYWLQRNDLMKEYAGKHIAYHNGEVIATADIVIVYLAAFFAAIGIAQEEGMIGI